ncbi:MAG: sigma-70 family RNA polymerase sigma factor [Planctomycetes bacterium]|nr:sigma-70 family RNA polymerase sigma factor [Planctomycetota bacterium]
MAGYHHAEIAGLAKQLAYAPAKVRLEQVNRAERLACILEASKTYPYEFVCYQVTGYRPRGKLGENLRGKTVREDLVRMVEDVSASLRLRREDVGEPVLSIGEARKRLNVSEKTIQRWRKAGLVSRKFIGGDGRLRVGFLESSLDRFVTRNHDRVEAGANFCRLMPEERREIIRRARRLSLFCHCCLFEVSKRIARKLGRAVETVRQTIKDYDREHPDARLFPDTGEPLQDHDRRLIYEAYQRGVSVHALAKRFCRTRSSIYRIVTEERAKELLREPIQYMRSPEFDRPDADQRILGDAAAEGALEPREKRGPTPPKGLPIYLKTLYKTPLLTKDQEQALFRRYNYLKFKAARIQARVQDSRAPLVEDIEEIERLMDGANRVKNRIIQANLRLVVNIAKRHVGPQTNFFELISDGNMSLMRAVDKFDYTRGFKFSTYASWAIMKNFARSVPQEGVRRDRFMTGRDELLEMSRDLRFEGEEAYREPDLSVRQNIEKVLDQLETREREIVMRRFGLGDMPAQTLEEVGRHYGVTKERIRQIETRALNKLRALLSPEALEEVLS